MNKIINEKTFKIISAINEYSKLYKELNGEKPPKIIYNKGWFELIFYPSQRELNYKCRLDKLESIIESKRRDVKIKNDREGIFNNEKCLIIEKNRL